MTCQRMGVYRKGVDRWEESSAESSWEDPLATERAKQMPRCGKREGKGIEEIIGE